jgi:hypothetical protein
MSAKKDKQARRLARKRKAQKSRVQQRSQPSTQKGLFKRVQSSEYFKNTKLIPNTGEVEKMSDVILRFAEPLQDEYGVVPPDMIRFAILVWNASVLPKEAQDQAFKDINKIIPNDDRKARQEMLMVISMLLERKDNYFSDNKRFIVDYNIRESSRRIHLDVASTLPEGYNPDL